MERNKAIAGFTLAEILVVIFIISLLSALTFANYRQGGKQMALQRSAQKLAQDIRRTEEMAIAATEYAGSVPPGYGIYLDRLSPTFCPGSQPVCYLLYADLDGNEYYSVGDQIIDTIRLEKDITISGISTPPQKVAINFKPPDPKIRIGWSAAAADKAASTTITLSLGSLTKDIEVNEAGLIEIK